MLFFENIKLALSAIKANKLRSFLTMLGIIIGISSVISITAIGASAQAVISDEFDNFGEAYMFISVNWRNPYVEHSDLFSREDVEALINRFPNDIRYAERVAGANSDIRVGRLEGRLSLQGVGANYNRFYRGMEIVHGRMINQSDIDGRRENIVLDINAARHFFNRENAVGSTIPANINGVGRDLTIVGVFDTPPSIFDGFAVSTSYSAYVPISLLMNDDDRSWHIEIFANENRDVIQQAEAFVSYMALIKGKPAGFYVFETAEGQMDQINTILLTLSVALGIIAGISLLVGGIGIMNIMLVSVTERTREIGIRKSLGARTRDILTQFLIEAMILSCIGGIIGTALGISVAGLGMSAFGINVVIQPAVVIVTVIFSAAVGMFFGIFPAKKAAKLDPIEALRYE